jgi:integrase/recombinase XerD
LGCFLRHVGEEKKLEDFSESWIECAVQHWTTDPDLQATTVRRRAACIKAMVRWLFRRKLISFNPLERLHLEIKVPKRLPRNLLTDEIRKLVAVKPERLSGRNKENCKLPFSRHDWDSLTARLVIEVMCLTGIRVGELVKIMPSEIDYELQQVLVHGKGNRERHVAFPDAVTLKRLKAYRDIATAQFNSENQDCVFRNSLGRRANEQYIRRIVGRFAEASEITRKVTPHMIRHTAATQLLEAGMDIRLVQRLLGHASITTTQIYTHVADHVLRTEIARVNVRRRLELHR